MNNRKVQPGEAIVENSVSTENTRNILNDSIGVIEGDVPITPQFTRISSINDIINPQTNVFYILGASLVYWDGNQWLKSQDFTPL